MNTAKHLSLIIALSLLAFTSCEQKYNQGKVMYEFHCSGCHLEDGTGLGEIYPPLTKSAYTLEHIHDFACIISKGMQGPITVDGKTYDGEMPGNKGLSAVEITNIINYMNHTFDYGLAPLKLEEIMKDLERCE